MHELLSSPREIGLIVLRTLVVYAFILGGLRLSGKREVGQLAPFDFALVLLIANAVQNAMVGPDTSLLGGLVAASVLLLANWGLGRLAANSRRIERLVRGRARLLVRHGQIDHENLCHRGGMPFGGAGDRRDHLGDPGKGRLRAGPDSQPVQGQVAMRQVTAGHPSSHPRRPLGRRSGLREKTLDSWPGATHIGTRRCAS